MVDPVNSLDKGDNTVHQRPQGHCLFSLLSTYLKSEQSISTNLNFESVMTESINICFEKSNFCLHN